jgi:hypothetical protein
MESKLYRQVGRASRGISWFSSLGKTGGLTFQLPRRLLYHGFGDASFYSLFIDTADSSVVFSSEFAMG